MAIELDHVFVLLNAADFSAAAATLAGVGLVETYRRRHHGQGTANVCFCFDDAFLELLTFVADDPGEHPRLTLRARAQRGSPVGLAVRGAGPLPFASWTYLLAGASDDVEQPVMFRGPGTEPPLRWPAARAGARQTASGLSHLGRPRLQLPAPPSPALRALVDHGVVEVAAGPPGLSLTARGPGSSLHIRFAGSAGIVRCEATPG